MTAAGVGRCNGWCNAEDGTAFPKRTQRTLAARRRVPQTNPTRRLTRCRPVWPLALHSGERPTTKRTQRPDSRGESDCVHDQIAKEPERAESPSRVAFWFSEGRLSANGLDTSESRPRENLARAKSSPSCRFFPPRFSLPTDLTRPRAAFGLSATCGESPVFASVASAPTSSLCQRTRHVREKRAGRVRRSWVSGAFPTASIKHYREKMES
jgi:hypothetical protein